MIIRIQGPGDRRRIEIDAKETLEKVISENYDISKFRISTDKEHKHPIDTKKPVGVLKLENGALLFLDYSQDNNKKEADPGPGAISSSRKGASSNVHGIHRKKDAVLCNHASNAMCAHCAPLDPWDKAYHAENRIKYLSFRSYKEMLKMNKKEYRRVDYKKKKCADHGENASCTRCQRMPITLCPQIFRSVDHVEFDCRAHIENFIKNCKASGRSRFGYLIGRYDDYQQVPLGTKVVVSWIYEPPQRTFPDGFVLEDNEDQNLVFAKNFGMEIIGMVYYSKERRDLLLSSLEIEFIAKFQLQFGNSNGQENAQPDHHTVRAAPRRSLRNGSSCFATILVRQNENNEYVLEEFMVSEQCMALVEEQLIVPMTDPALFLTREEISYRCKDGVKREDRIPVDFFMVRLTHGMKHNPFFLSQKKFDRLSGLKKIADYFGGSFTMEAFSNYDLILRLSGEMDVRKLIEAVCKRDEEKTRAFVGSNEFQELRKKLKQYEVQTWSCEACTYINNSNLPTCEMCGTSK